MSMMNVPTLAAGERSLPSELRTRRGRSFAHRRLMNGMRGVGGMGDGDTTEEFIPPVITEEPPVLDPTFPIDPNQFVGPMPGTGSNPCGSGFLVDGVCQSSLSTPPPYVAPTGFQTSIPVGQQAPTAPSGYQWVTAANAASQSLAKILAITQGGTVMQLPNGQQIITGSPGANVGLLSGAGAVGQISQYMPYLLMAGAAVLLFSFMGRGR